MSQEVNILPQHSLVSRDDVVISGLSTVLTQVNQAISNWYNNKQVLN